MNKKYIAFSLLGLFALTMVSAMVVTYLSDTSTADVTVDYATEVAFANIDSEAFPLTGSESDDWVANSLTLPDKTQLSTILAGVQIKNNADVAIEGKILKLTVSNDLNNVTCGDITSLMFLDTATPTQLAKGYQQLVSLCSEDGNTAVYNIDINSLSSKTTYEYPAKVTFGVISPTDYTFTAQMVLA